MKATNQFDYPSKASQSYKSYQQEDMIDTRQKTNYQKTRYKQHMQHVKQSQRLKVKEQQNKKMEQEKQQNKAKIRSQIERKKKQLQQLQKIRLQTEQNQRRSYQLALIKQQQDKIKKLQQERRTNQNKENAEARFQMALKRLDQEKQQAHYKERQAEQRRKAAEHMQKFQREKAIKYKQYLQEKQRNAVPQQKVTFQEYKQNLGRSTYNKNIDYTKTCLHNPKIIIEKTQQEKTQNAFEQGNKARQHLKQKSEEKRKSNQENHQKSLQRGKQALKRVQREKQYMKYEQQTSQQQKQYNLQRLQAGKKNQYTGIKPTTLEQMQTNKKQRSQEEFNKMFFQPQVVSSDRFNRGATKYEIVQTRMAPNKASEDLQVSFKKSKKYLNKKEQSQIPCVSEGKYSFEEPEYSQFNKSDSRSQNQTGHIYQRDLQNQQENHHQFPEKDSNTKPDWKQTGFGFEKPTNQNMQNVKPIIKESYEKSSKNSRKQFDTEEMLRKYGIKRDSPQKYQIKNRKVVGMSNICEKQQRQKQELSYSQSEDSFT